MIVCGWCGKATDPGRCAACGRDPALPWVQRGTEPPAVAPHERELAAAAAGLRAEGRKVTSEALAEVLDVSPRTVRRWQGMSA